MVRDGWSSGLIGIRTGIGRRQGHDELPTLGMFHGLASIMFTSIVAF